MSYSSIRPLDNFNTIKFKTVDFVEGKGRKFLEDDQIVSMNKIVYQFKKSIPKNPTPEDIVKIQQIYADLQALDKDATDQLSEKNVSKWQRIRTSIRQGLGNFFFAVGHLGFNKAKWMATVPVKYLATSSIDQDSRQILDETPPFNGYRIELDKQHPCNGVVLTGVSLRPSNLFFAALFEGTEITTTLPGSKELFAFSAEHEVIRAHLEQSPEAEVAFSACGTPGYVVLNKKKVAVADLSELYGDKTYAISHQELLNILESQRIYTSSLLPLQFYADLKKAMKADEIITLPGKDLAPVLLKEMRNDAKHPEIGKFLAEVEENPQNYGFSNPEHLEMLMGLTLYQIGAMVVKTEDFHIFMDGHGKIIERQTGEKDAIRLINACGIRGIAASPREHNKQIMTETFHTAFVGAENGIVICPAVGMGVWRGNPDLYWRALLDGYLSSPDTFDAVYVNPGHQKTSHGKYAGVSGEEFQLILNDYIARAQTDQEDESLAKLLKIHNLFDSKKDVVQLAHNLKKAFPDTTVSLLNASDPDVTLGYHVGEYVNNMPHTYTTEENYTAMGTNGLCFEGITGVHEDPSRLFHVNSTT